MSSTRDRAKRLNQGVFISGASGTGKSRMTARLAEHWQRVIYVDPMASFTTASVHQWEDAEKSLATFWRSRVPMNFGVTFFDANDYARFFGALALLMRTLRGQNPNFLLVVDEVDLWSGPKHIDPNLGHILRYGRHYGCSWIANCRADVHTNRDVRMNAAEILLFRQGMLSPELSKMVAAVTNSHATNVAQLTRHGPDEPKNAVEGTHFIALPEPFDEWLPTWQALATDA